MSMSANMQATLCMEFVDQQGDPKFLTKTEWVEMLEILIDECQSRLEAAREELADE